MGSSVDRPVDATSIADEPYDHGNTRTQRTSPYLTATALDALITRALEEDVGAGDVTTQATVGPDVQAEARLHAKEPGIVAGLTVTEHVFRRVDVRAAVVCRLSR